MSAACRALLLLLPAWSLLLAQIPQAAQTDLYFPHLADGGPAGAQWQTRFTFINPNSGSAAVALFLYADSGSPLPLNLGAGAASQFTFNVPGNGTVVLQSQGTSLVTTTGWAIARASLPVHGNVAFRLLQNRLAKLEITAEPTLPSISYRAVATPQVGIAVANGYNSSSLPAQVTVYSAAGQVLGRATVTIPALGHSSFNLGQLIPGLPAGFTGSVVITPSNAGQVLLGWAVYSDSSGVISSLPDGRAGFPVFQFDQINNAFARLVAAYNVLLPAYGAAPQLVIGTDNGSNAINAFAVNGNTVTINLALAQLISDSPSELAFAIGHELGHIYQQRTGNYDWYSDREWDADVWGLLSELTAGYDPYAGAGVLGKLGMATGTANLGIQQWEDSQLAADAHGSFSTRINNLTTFVEVLCAVPSVQSLCSNYKSVVHPNFPASPSVPLVAPRQPGIHPVRER